MSRPPLLTSLTRRGMAPNPPYLPELVGHAKLADSGFIRDLERNTPLTLLLASSIGYGDLHFRVVPGYNDRDGYQLGNLAQLEAVHSRSGGGKFKRAVLEN